MHFGQNKLWQINLLLSKQILLSALIADYFKYHICLVKNLNIDGTVQQSSSPYNKIRSKLPLGIVGIKNTCKIPQFAIHNSISSKIKNC